MVTALARAMHCLRFMNERHLRRLIRRLVMLSAPLPLAIGGAACGGSAAADASGSAGAATAGGSSSGGAAGSLATGGSSVGGASVGGSSVGGSSVGGSSVGGSAGSGLGGGGASAGGAGAGGSGTAGAGGANACSGNLVGVCAGGIVTVPRTCVAAGMDVMGTNLPSATCMEICGARGSALACSVTAVDTSSVTVNCFVGCATGRRPAGLCMPVALSAGELGAYFAEVCQLEAASVQAFRILQSELRAHGSPKMLVRAAARAARDEVRHTRAMGALARRFGARPRAVQVERGAPRSIEAIALENAVEGCVRETYGALLATSQARVARDPVVRAAMVRIARDETRHAALSWRVGRWLEARLDRGAKARVEVAKRAAALELLTAAANDAPPSFAALAGLPSAGQASQLVQEMKRALWS